ncbi:2Fe-2S iron-sulfur cluster-binding protein [Candidatus Protofrankia californiensis]|uniref:2Fe-2S iron-sulfur cluster-binding protein n=1 Tax=Candidatus Protofrankia californiensis TaxID=1839754 RepID=UPI00104142F0|nr:2Fe-2S iron-sulfur cluster-binding protein [Candidatus Protofrankia californiensis]
MPKITCINDYDGSRWELNVDSGCSVMEATVNNNVPGIVAECGGSCSCATCHVYVDESWLGKLEEATQEEKDLIEFLDGARSNSRLSCQVLLTDELDGLTLRIPESQE